MNFYPFNIGDYAGKTRHLTWDEDMAYRRLLDVYYSTEAPLPPDRNRIHRLAGAQTTKQKQAVDAVLGEFFDLHSDGYRNTRCDEEITKTAAKKAKAQQSAAMRWNGMVHNEGNANASADAMRTHSEGNAPNPNPNPNIKNRTVSHGADAPSIEPEGFSEFWDTYPKRDGSPDRKGAAKAFKAALRRATLQTILDGADHFRDAMTARGKVGTEFIPQARTWLNGERWNDRYDTASAADSRQAQNLAILEKYRAPSRA